MSFQDALGPPEVCPRAPQGAPSIIQVRPKAGNTTKTNVFSMFFEAPRGHPRTPKELPGIPQGPPKASPGPPRTPHGVAQDPRGPPKDP